MVSQESHRSQFCDLTECERLQSFLLPPPARANVHVTASVNEGQPAGVTAITGRAKKQAQLTPSRTGSFSSGEVTSTLNDVAPFP